jgi:hypothetical protein
MLLAWLASIENQMQRFRMRMRMLKGLQTRRTRT